MSSHTRTRKVRTAAGVHTVQLPRQRGRRSQPFVVVVPEQPSLTREALGFVGRGLWSVRQALAPTGFAVLALGVTTLMHTIAWWSALVLAPAAFAPAVWFAVMQRSRPAHGSTLLWRFALGMFATLAFTWAALAAGFGPWAGALPLVWLLALIMAQTVWLFIRRTH
ncbi:hypothetical protein [Streptomyces sp. TRM68416]|uniref:hypothetical protein n=1 Tax=Streptomyces sp. TRM68416 TaxID=2758412 RepID=UPI001661AB13|nr:hypothetical protein [Streptomyces sp. TRM68416]MBD0838854.1 hypothetical protein [Streptomyces sp. TRM68416]